MPSAHVANNEEKFFKRSMTMTSPKIEEHHGYSLVLNIIRILKSFKKINIIAEQNSLRFIPAVFSHTGQIHDEFKAFVREQVRHKLIDFEGEAKNSRIRAVMRWWSKCISIGYR